MLGGTAATELDSLLMCRSAPFLHRNVCHQSSKDKTQ